MATILNPRKKFHFEVVFPLVTEADLPKFSVQMITIGDNEVEVVEHGYGNTVLKTAGLVKPANVTLDRIMPAGVDLVSAAYGNYFWEWQKLAQNALVGSGGNPTDYKKVMEIRELANDGTSILNTWFLVGAWPSMINGREFDRTASENTVESVELAVDFISLDIDPGTLAEFGIVVGAG